MVRSSKAFGLLGRDVLSLLNSGTHLIEEEDGYQPGLPIKGYKARLRLKPGAVPIFAPCREPPLALEDDVNKEIDQMEKDRVISKVNGGSQWASPLVVARKPNGKIRICVDYKITVNPHIMRDSCNAPPIETIFSKIGDCQFFAKFDLKAAFWQIELEENSKNLTTINTTRGLYQFNRLPFGLKTSSAIFQKSMLIICEHLEGIVVYQDDILVYGHTAEELKARVEKLLKRLHKKNVVINWDKSTRQCGETTFLGHDEVLQEILNLSTK